MPGVRAEGLGGGAGPPVGRRVHVAVGTAGSTDELQAFLAIRLADRYQAVVVTAPRHQATVTDGEAYWRLRQYR